MSIDRLSRLARIATLAAIVLAPVAATAQTQAQSLPQALVNAWALPGHHPQPQAVVDVNPIVANAYGIPTVAPMPAMASTK